MEKVLCVEILSIPSGPYPEEVRKALVGLRLPFGRDLSDGILGDSYPVLAETAIKTLTYYNPVAAAVLGLWLIKNPRGTLFFNTQACKLEMNTPSLTEQTAPHMKDL